MIRENWGFDLWLPEPVSSYAGEIDWLMNLLHVVMVGIFVVWSIYFVYCLVAYRARDGQRGVYHQSGEKASFIPDGLILAFEMWLILAFGIPIWAAVKQGTPPPEDSLQVNLVAQQFAWNFQYPGPDGKFGRRDISLVSASNPIGLDDKDPDGKDDIVTINNLNVPVGKPTILNMTSKDVIHDFQVVNLRNKQDVVPGMHTRLWFTPEKTGKFEIGCAQLCGLGHTQMVGNVFVQTAEEFADWQKAQVAEKTGTADARDVAPTAEGRS
ncbi:MAG TPA: cytochrome c oxidase subunit II [Candidatus Binatia bacterium]|nr:cytochrome c oxidase subunit II [Candidatus Binatia bacterium]